MNDDVIYLKTIPKNLRKSYGTGRSPMKMSFTEELYEKLHRAQIITRIRNEGDELVSRKGGYGSPFAEFAMEFILSALISNDPAKTHELTRISKVASTLVPEQNTALFARNLHAIAYMIEEDLKRE